MILEVASVVVISPSLAKARAKWIEALLARLAVLH